VKFKFVIEMKKNDYIEAVHQLEWVHSLLYVHSV